jgi:membrane-associated phospholipid phosphatase
VNPRSNAVLWGIAAVAAFVAFFALGRDVVANGEPLLLIDWERPLTGHSSLVAWWLTWACYPQVLIPICIVLLLVAWRAPAWRGRALLSVVLLLFCWRGADFFQHVFARPRRVDWAVKHETSFSYPSSHAAIATGFYGLWALMLYLSDLPALTRRIGAALVALLALATCWSRLALGAHYVTDLAGGTLLGVAFASAALAIFPNALAPKVVAGRGSSAAE